MEPHNQHLERMTQNLRRDMLLDQQARRRPGKLARWMERNPALWTTAALALAVVIWLIGTVLK